mgnify:FL=1|jgi:hypothetical protein
MTKFIKFTFNAFDKEFTVHTDSDVETKMDLANETSKALTKANREFLDKFLQDGIDPYPGWWSNSSPTDFYWSTGNNFD